MAFTDVLKSALAKKHAALHPDADKETKENKKTVAPTKPVANKPQKKVTGRGR